jgi:leucyl/phenylalanyl-tRNA--protein transferase
MPEKRLHQWPNDFLDADADITAVMQFDGGEMIIAIGGQLNPMTVKAAYSNGLFPWGKFQGENVWCSPNNRFVLFPQELKISKSLRPFINRRNYEVRVNTNFEGVLIGCKEGGRKKRESTWIFDDLYEAMKTLNQEGFTISYELYMNGELCGGLFGQKIGRIFSGDSMFSNTPNASKLVLHYLCNCGEFDLIDCQSFTPYLQSMGAKFISRKAFIELLILNQFESNGKF